jgi:pantoate--beta-alanine ligase
MQVVDTVAGLRAWRRSVAGSVGFVPTMGFLHEGHLALVQRAKAENDLVAVSVFVNPRQFGSAEDLAKYPRDVARDLDLLRGAGTDLVFTPPVEEIYPAGFDSAVEVGGITKPLEGAARPGHFRGVTTVVGKLFNLVQPERAYFGQKDAQQVLVIQKMVADLAFPVEIVAVPTVRDADGLALSSRNARLSPEERQAAARIPQALGIAYQAFAAGERDADAIRRTVLDCLAAEPLLQPEYVSLADPATLAEVERIDGGALLSLAVQAGSVRLIDNILLTAEHGDQGHWIEEGLLACPYPAGEDGLGRLAEAGVSVVVNLDERAHDPVSLARFGLREVHLPVKDFTAPSRDQLEQGVAVISQALMGGERVAVHCGAGLGRTGTLLACYLVSQGSPAQEAMARVRSLRPGSVETAEQERAVHDYATARA